MASFNDLPIELIHKIIDCTVEDAVAVNKDKLQGFILVKLALVSKAFTRYSQVLLWKFITLDTFSSMAQIVGGKFEQNRVIERFTFLAGVKGIFEDNFSMVKSILRGVQSVEEFVISFWGHESDVVIKMDDFFEIASMRGLKAFESGFDLSFHLNRNGYLPSLQKLIITEFCPTSDNFFLRIINSSINTLVFLELNNMNFINSHYSPEILKSLQVVAAKLTTLKLYECGEQFTSSLLPLCSSLKSLTLNSNHITFRSNIQHLGTLPVLSRLHTLSIYIGDLLHSLPYEQGEFPISLVGNEVFTLFVKALDLPELDLLKTLYCDVGCALKEPKRDLAVKFVKERVDFIEKVERRKINVFYKPELVAKDQEEREKQQMYQERQEELDMKIKN